MDRLYPTTPAPEAISTEQDVRRAQSAVMCDICGSPMQEHHCKLVCHSCGFIRDCTDP